MAAHNDFSWFRGEDILLTFTMSPVTNIAGWTISLAVKSTLYDAATVLTLVGTIADAAGGIFTVPISAAQNTTTLSSGDYAYAAQRTDSGSVAVLSEGSIKVKPSAKLA